jgi:hypothetical protein
VDGKKAGCERRSIDSQMVTFNFLRCSVSISLTCLEIKRSQKLIEAGEHS